MDSDVDSDLLDRKNIFDFMIDLTDSVEKNSQISQNSNNMKDNKTNAILENDFKFDVVSIKDIKDIKYDVVSNDVIERPGDDDDDIDNNCDNSNDGDDDVINGQEVYDVKYEIEDIESNESFSQVDSKSNKSNQNQTKSKDKLGDSFDELESKKKTGISRLCHKNDEQQSSIKSVKVPTFSSPGTEGANSKLTNIKPCPLVNKMKIPQKKVNGFVGKQHSEQKSIKICNTKMSEFYSVKHTHATTNSQNHISSKSDLKDKTLPEIDCQPKYVSQSMNSTRGSKNNNTIDGVDAMKATGGHQVIKGEAVRYEPCQKVTRSIKNDFSRIQDSKMASQQLLNQDDNDIKSIANNIATDSKIKTNLEAPKKTSQIEEHNQSESKTSRDIAIGACLINLKQTLKNTSDIQNLIVQKKEHIETVLQLVPSRKISSSFQNVKQDSPETLSDQNNQLLQDKEQLEMNSDMYAPDAKSNFSVTEEDCDLMELTTTFQEYDSEDNNFENNSIYENSIEQEEEEVDSPSLECSFCLKIFQYAKNLKRHIQTHETDNHYSCHLCGLVFINMESLLYHKAVHTTEPRKYKCQRKCKEEFSQYSLFLEHMNQHENPKCEICSRRFRNLFNFNKHMVVHDVSKCKHCHKVVSRKYLPVHIKKCAGIKDLKCEICGKEYYQRSQYNKHVRKHTEEKQYKCLKCPKDFFTKPDLKRHQLVHEPKKTFKCDVCDFTTCYNDSLVNHMGVHKGKKTQTCKICNKKVVHLHSHMRVHRVDKNCNKCEVCDKTFVDPRDLKKHISIHTGLNREDPVQCDICKKMYKDKDCLRKHKMSHRDTRDYKCNVCFKTFKTLQCQKAHTTKVHSEIKKTCKCSFCGKCFFSNSALKRHLVIHQPNVRPFKCDICGLTFKLKQDIRSHTKSVHDETSSYKCYDCGQELSSSNSLKRHIDLVHKNHLKPFKCVVCGLQFALKTSLKHHQKSHVEEKPDSFPCDICNEPFKTMSNLKTHMSKHHNNVTPMQCKFCNKTFLTRHHYKSHQKFHKDNCFLCDICGKQFKTFDQCQTHKTIHTGEKSLQCHICGQLFRCRSNLVVHMVTHGKKNYHNCDVCDESFRYFSDLTNHKKTVHNILTRFKCDVCSKVFIAKSSFREHMKIYHSSLPVKRYTCEICDKNFLRYRHLKRHHATHTERYQCEDCGQKFILKTSLNQHLKNKH